MNVTKSLLIPLLLLAHGCRTSAPPPLQQAVQANERILETHHRHAGAVVTAPTGDTQGAAAK